MTKGAVEAIIGRAVLDSKFRERLFADPEQALAEYGLAEAEVDVLKGIDAEAFQSFAGSLDERISKSDYQGVLSYGWVGVWAGESGSMRGWPYQEII
jgi:hypothetical protein